MTMIDETWNVERNSVMNFASYFNSDDTSTYMYNTQFLNILILSVVDFALYARLRLSLVLFFVGRMRSLPAEYQGPYARVSKLIAHPSVGARSSQKASSTE